MHSHCPPRSRRRALCAGLLTILAATVTPLGTMGVAGQETTATTVPAPTTAPPSTTAPTPTTGQSRSPGGAGDVTTTTSDPAGTPVTNPDGTPVTNPDGTPVTMAPDKASGEQPPDATPPVVDVTIPPRTNDKYANQNPFVGNRVLISNVIEARAKVIAAEQAHNDAIALVKVMRLRQKALTAEREALDAQVAENLSRLEVARQRLNARALTAFVEGGAADLAGTLGSVVDGEGAMEYEVQKTLVETVFESDEAAIDDFTRIRSTLDAQSMSLLERSRVLVDTMNDVVADVELRAVEAEQARRELEAFEAGSQIYIEGVVFPIEWPYEIPLIDSWGFPRMMGSADAHWHEGIDIFAPEGTPLLATERGIVTKIGSGRLGGLRLWLRGESGTDWYYAHLSGFVRGLTEGQLVEAGDVIGYVGDTGNAVGTPFHLHMQVHPNGGDPVNPYPLLKVVSDREIAAREQEALEGN